MANDIHHSISIILRGRIRQPTLDKQQHMQTECAMHTVHIRLVLFFFSCRHGTYKQIWHMNINFSPIRYVYYSSKKSICCLYG